MLTLITTLHTSCDSRRAVEYKTCLDINLANPFIDSVKVILETERDTDYGFLQGFENDKLEVIPVRKRPFFSDLFAVANKCMNGEVIIICNGDIYFDGNSHVELASKVLAHEFWTVSRYEEQPDGQWQLYDKASIGSHDCWIFRSPIDLPQSRYHLGILGCDQILAQRAVESGFNVLNPCLSIKPRHLHRYNIRNNTLDRVSRCYWNERDYLKLGLKAYCAQPCILEAKRICSMQTLYYKIMHLIGQHILPLYRSNFIQRTLSS